MTSEQEIRLRYTINNADLEIAAIQSIIAESQKRLEQLFKAKNEAALELNEMQLTLNLRCSTCGD